MAALLAIYRPHLQMLQDSSANIAKLLFLPELREIAEVMTLGRAVPEAHQLATALLERLKVFDLVGRLLAIDEDILGVYEYNLNDRQPPKIRLFWGVIGLVSQAEPLIDLESLTALVMAHELAHAYTHLGLDIDDRRWPTQAFYETAKGVKEGLAQYYAARVMIRLKERLPLGEQTYVTLLEKQPPVYHSHQPWLENYTPEVVRTAFISGRGEVSLTIPRFDEALKALSPHFQRRPAKRTRTAQEEDDVF